MKMQETTSPDIGLLTPAIFKFFPPILGAAIMIAVDPPKTKRDLFTRAFVAFAASYLFGDFVFDWMDSSSMLAFLDTAKRAHHTAVDGVVGATGWFVAGGAVHWLKRFRKDPTGTIKQTKDDVL